jgi:hypothetical protein
MDKNHISRKEIAEDILDFCRKNKKKFFSVKYSVGKIMCVKKGRTYSASELAQGIRYANERGAMTRISNYRWHIDSYELKEVKK